MVLTLIMLGRYRSIAYFYNIKFLYFLMCIVQYLNNRNNTLNCIKKSNITSITEESKYLVKLGPL